MTISKPVRSIILIWLGWVIVMFAFQGLVQARLTLERPDHVLGWTASETTSTANDDQLYLIDPFLNGHVAWDSEFYLAIAADGYNSPHVRAIPSDYVLSRFFCRPGTTEDCYSLSYAFFPVYPLLIRIFSMPLRFLPISQIAEVTLAGVIVSLLGSLLAMISLFHLTRSRLGDESGVKASFYLLIFPSGFFLAQVYSEGVFLGITFASLAFLEKRKWVWAGLLAALAAWTRPGGAILVLPLVLAWFLDKNWLHGWKTALIRLSLALSPAISYGIWRLTPLAKNFFLVEGNFFGRGLMLLNKSLQVWQYAWNLLLKGAPETRFYYGLEFAAIILGIVCCLILLRNNPILALYGLAVIFFALTSGAAQGMVRYVLAAPPLFIVLARWGKNLVFDRIWTLACVLLMSVGTILFSFDFWVA